MVDIYRAEKQQGEYQPLSPTRVNNCISIYHTDTKKLVLIISFNILMHCLTFYLHKFVKTVASAVAELKV